MWFNFSKIIEVISYTINEMQSVFIQISEYMKLCPREPAVKCNP